MLPLNLELMRNAIGENRIEWRKHVLEKLIERRLKQRDVLHILLEGERVRDYLEDRPFPSALFLGKIGGRPLHVVASYDEVQQKVYVITAYEPSLDVFETDYRTKKRKL